MEAGQSVAEGIQLRPRDSDVALVFLVGPPYCGKSSACEAIKKRFGDKIEALSMGAILRASKDETTQAKLANGELVDRFEAPSSPRTHRTVPSSCVYHSR